MESDRQRSYSVLTEKEIRLKMEKEVEKISEIFSVSKSAATVVLLRHRWNIFRVSDRLGDDTEKFLAESGLKSVVSDHDEKVSTCGICLETYQSDQTLVLISTSFCSHHFCRTCWTKYLRNCLDQNQSAVSCPNPDCHAAVGPDTIQQLPREVKKMYGTYVLRAYMESKKEVIKWCPAPDCEYAVELLEHSDADDCFSVVCVCAHIFCWKCQLESHRPLTCNNASDWLRIDGDTDESLSLTWIVINTKPCPKCFRPIERDDASGCDFLNCASPCRFLFCWNCLQPVNAHRGRWSCSTAFLPDSAPPEVYERRDLAISSSEKYSICLDRWEAAHKAMQQAVSDLHNIENSKMHELCEKFDKSEKEMEFIREAWMLIVQCRQVLKWSYVYEYFLSDYESAKRQYLQHLQDEATNILQRFSENVEKETQQALLSETFQNLNSFRCKLSDLTSATGNFFHYFVKTLEEGLPDVKVNSYDDVGGLHWFCDICTYQNTWLDKECKLCYDGLDSP